MAARWVVAKGVWSDDLKLVWQKKQSEGSMSWCNLMSKMVTLRDYETSTEKGTKVIF